MFGLLRRFFPVRRVPDKGVSVICAYNDAAKLERFLLPSLAGQTARHELLTIDNTSGRHASAPEILNETARTAQYDYLMFVHQDVALDSGNWLAEAMRSMEGLPRLGAAGVAGMSRLGLAASVSHGVPPFFIGPRRLKRPTPVQTLDGCLLLVPREVFERTPFDADTVRGWYFYVLDYCLRLRRLGLKSYVLPQHVYHESMGPGDPAVYQDALDRIRAAHRDHVRTIYGTMGAWKTRD